MVYEPGQTGKCPHCLYFNRFEFVRDEDGRYFSDRVIEIKSERYNLRMCCCTSCGEIIIYFGGSMIYPSGTQRPPCPEEVPENIQKDYKEACLVEPHSKKAAATLARRCLQHILQEQGIQKRNLNEEIETVIPQLPSYLGEDLDSIRNIGNFAAHPTKYTDDAEKIVEVEDEEAEWVLDVIEELFDFYYVSPKKKEGKRKALDEKLREAGKPGLGN